MRYAAGVYGWPWLLHGSPLTGLARLWRRLVCCAPCRRRPAPALGDNCCLCNTAALQAWTELPERDLVYLSFVNRLYQVAFLVAVDHAARSVVLAVRGTLSLTDAITDLCLDSAAVDEAAPADHRAHRGILRAARYVLTTLKETAALERALGQNPDYALVITGHSLGGGAAALLAHLLRPAYPGLQCVAFSPPGGLVSGPLSEQMRQYVLSVVCGDDLVPRLSVAAVDSLRRELQLALSRCPLSKHALLYRACCNCVCGADHELDREVTEDTDPHQPLVPHAHLANYVSKDGPAPATGATRPPRQLRKYLQRHYKRAHSGHWWHTPTAPTT